MYCGWFEGFHIAIHCIVLQKKNQCIAMGIVLQDGCRKPKCVAIKNCIVTRGAGTGRRQGAGRAGWALGWAWQQVRRGRWARRQAQAARRWARGLTDKRKRGV